VAQAKLGRDDASRERDLIAQSGVAFPSPLEGEGAQAEAKPSEGGRGVSAKRAHQDDPSPGSAALPRAFATLSLKGRGEIAGVGRLTQQERRDVAVSKRDGKLSPQECQARHDAARAIALRAFCRND